MFSRDAPPPPQVLGLSEGRSSEKWQDYSLDGHQIVCHWVGPDYRCQDYYNPVGEFRHVYCSSDIRTPQQGVCGHQAWICVPSVGESCILAGRSAWIFFACNAALCIHTLGGVCDGAGLCDVSSAWLEVLGTAPAISDHGNRTPHGGANASHTFVYVLPKLRC